MAEITEKVDPEVIHLFEYDGVCAFVGTEFEKVKDLKCRDSDVWVCSFPRSGTTLTQQMTYLVRTLDFEKARSVVLDARFPWIEYEDDAYQYFRGPDYVTSLPESEPRMIKSHLHYRHLPRELQQGTGKIIYTVRNPRAAVPSLYKFMKYIKNKPADTLRQYLEQFLTGKNVYACPWGLHVREYWDHSQGENVLVLQFEQTITDRHGTVRKIAEFLGVELTDDNVDQIVEQTTLESMSNNQSVNLAYYDDRYNTDPSEGRFINKGEISGWRKDIPEDLLQQFDEMIEREIGHTDINFTE